MFKALSDKWVSMTKGTPQALLKKCARFSDKTVLLYGAGEIGSAVLDLVDKDDSVKIEAVFDRKAEYIELKVKGYEVMSPKALSQYKEAVILIASEKFIQDMSKDIKAYAPDAGFTLVHI